MNDDVKKKKRLPKNIIICADGTGNKGGSSPDSNVYRLYKMINKNFTGSHEKRSKVREQILFYDNGVGTAKNKLIRAASAGIGLGFRHNVCDLYKFIARNYEEHDQVPDQIYFFGFSRGASTVRACNGMISKAGLVKSDGLGNSALDKRVDEAYKKYKDHMRKGTSIDTFRENKETSWGAVPIQFLGVWDTVVALGFPKRTEATDPVAYFIKKVFSFFETISDFLSPHNFYHYRLTDNVNYACQALAIDDERTAFWPYVWKEKNIGKGVTDRTPDNVNQVWFAGMHANVGGGYERDGMAGVPLYWIMKQAEEKGLIFNSSATQLVLDSSHEHGRMYNTRLGLKMMYRYHPREIEKLSKTDDGKDILLGNIKIHESVIERLRHRTANYTPGHIPDDFDIIYTDKSKVDTLKLSDSSNWSELRRDMDKVVLYRKWLYSFMAFWVIVLLAFSIYYWFSAGTDKEVLALFAGFLNTVSFDKMSGLVNLVVIKKPIILAAIISVTAIAYYCTRSFLFEKTTKLGEALRHIIVSKAPKEE